MLFYILQSKIEKNRGIFKVKSQEKTRQVRENCSVQLEHKQVPKKGTEPDFRKGKRSLLACHACFKLSMETTRNSVKVKFGIKVMKSVKSLISTEVAVAGQGSEGL